MKKVLLSNILFGKNDELDKNDKKTEKQVLQALEEFLTENDPEDFEAVLPQIKNEIKDRFEEIKSNKLIFRGICLTTETFKKMFWSSLNDKAKEMFYKIQDGLTNPSDFVKVRNIKKKKKKGHQIQSWTSRKDIALSFAGSNQITVVFIAKMNTPNLFFGKPGELAKAVNSEYLEEMESISIGPVLCEEMYFGPTVANEGIQKILKSKIFDSSK